jgi:hypothetical protein
MISLHLLTACISAVGLWSVVTRWRSIWDFVRSYQDPVVKSVRVFYSTETDSVEKSKDITDEVFKRMATETDIMLTPRPFMQWASSARIEVRYLYKGKKYRQVSASAFPYPPKRVHHAHERQESIRKAVLESTGEDVTHRLRKYHGPKGDFHGYDDGAFPIAWCFPEVKMRGSVMIYYDTLFKEREHFDTSMSNTSSSSSTSGSEKTVVHVNDGEEQTAKKHV